MVVVRCSMQQHAFVRSLHLPPDPVVELRVGVRDGVLLVSVASCAVLTNAAELDAFRGQPRVRVVGSNGQAELGTRREHAVRFVYTCMVTRVQWTKGTHSWHARHRSTAGGWVAQEE